MSQLTHTPRFPGVEEGDRWPWIWRVVAVSSWELTGHRSKKFRTNLDRVSKAVIHGFLPSMSSLVSDKEQIFNKIFWRLMVDEVKCKSIVALLYSCAMMHPSVVIAWYVDRMPARADTCLRGTMHAIFNSLIKSALHLHISWIGVAAISSCQPFFCGSVCRIHFSFFTSNFSSW